jgi:uncharacterized damage-inducible protein DinB
MSLSAAFIVELQQEARVTRKMLERLPAEEFDWKPHEKSMTLGGLAVHVAEMTGWITETVNSDALDFAAMDYKPLKPQTTAEVLEYYEGEIGKAINALQTASDEHLMQNWTLKNGETVFFTMPRVQVLRGMCLNNIVHHRGQLSVYMRMKDVPVPAIYGPSADEKIM